MNCCNGTTSANNTSLNRKNIQAKINASSKEIGQLMAKGNKKRQKKLNGKWLSGKHNWRPINCRKQKKILKLFCTMLPNLPSDKVPAGKTPEDNVVIREGGSRPDSDRRRSTTLGSGHKV